MRPDLLPHVCSLLWFSVVVDQIHGNSGGRQWAGKETTFPLSLCFLVWKQVSIPRSVWCSTPWRVQEESKDVQKHSFRCPSLCPEGKPCSSLCSHTQGCLEPSQLWSPCSGLCFYFIKETDVTSALLSQLPQTPEAADKMSMLVQITL